MFQILRICSRFTKNSDLWLQDWAMQLKKENNQKDFIYLFLDNAQFKQL